jgi:hypothetical protein
MPPSQSAVAEQRKAARRLDEARQLLDEISNLLTEMRRTMLPGARPRE